MDYSTIFTGHDVTGVIAAMIGAAALIAVLGFARWASRKVADFFDGGQVIDAKSDRTIGGWYSHEQGMTGHESNHRAVAKSVDRHMRKGRS